MSMESIRRSLIPHNQSLSELRTILEIDESLAGDALHLNGRIRELESALNDLQIDYSIMQDAYLSTCTHLETVSKEKELLMKELSSLKSHTQNRDNYFKKIIEYVSAEMASDKMQSKRRLTSLRQENTRLKKQLISPKISRSATTSDMDEELNNLQEESKNSYLWELQELFVKYMEEDNRLKRILFPVLRTMFDHPSKQDMLEHCDRLFEEISLYEKDLRRTEKIGSLVEEFLSGTNTILYDDDDPEN